MLDHIALLRAIKKKYIYKNKKLFPTDRPCLEKGIYGSKLLFFFLALGRVNKDQKKWKFGVSHLGGLPGLGEMANGHGRRERKKSVGSAGGWDQTWVICMEVLKYKHKAMAL